MKRIVATICSAWAAAACATTGEVLDAVADEPRVSVEIPLEGPLRVDGVDLLRVHALLDERTEFAAADFRLREVVLVARSEAATAGRAELLIMDWRSGQFEIPPARSGEWYEVRLPAPPTDIDGAWLLDLNGDLTVDTLVAVLEPRPLAGHATAPRTVYRVVAGAPTRVITHWVHSPSHYHIYRYHHGWPYRYFWGVWNYDLVYRPHHRHYRHYRNHRHHRAGALARELRKLRRVHPRVRPIRHRDWRRGSERRAFVSAERGARRQGRGANASERRGSARSTPAITSRNTAGVARPLPPSRDYRRRGSRDTAAHRVASPRALRSPRGDARPSTHASRPAATRRSASSPARPQQRGSFPHRQARGTQASHSASSGAGRAPRHTLGSPSRRVDTGAAARRDFQRSTGRPQRVSATHPPRAAKPPPVSAKPSPRSGKPSAHAAKPPLRQQPQSTPPPRRADPPSEAPRRSSQRSTRIATP